MNVIRQEINEQGALLTVQLKKEDYQAGVSATLEKQRKNAKIPGFRPGKVPMALIQKQVGKAVLLEEMNKLVNAALTGHVRDNSLDILGNPIPKEDIEVKGDFDAPGDFEFTYEIGYAPKIQLDFKKSAAFDYVKVKIDDALIDKQLDDLRRRYGKLISVDAVGESDMVLAQFVELNEDGSIKEGGIMHSSTTSLEFIEDAKVKATIVGKVKGDKVAISATSITRGDRDKAAMLGVKEEELANYSDSYQMTINDIKRMELADLNQELYDKLFGEGAIDSEKALRDRIAGDLEQMFSNDSDRLLTRNVYKNLVDTTPVALPDDFLKRWIRLSNDKPVTAEQIDQDYDNYSKDLKWQLIQGHIFKANDIQLDQKEALEFTKGLLINQYAQYGLPAPDEKELTTQAAKALSNREEANRIFDMLAEVKLTEFFKNNVKLATKEVSYDDFVAMASN